jgi:hypothetical protein
MGRYQMFACDHSRHRQRTIQLHAEDGFNWQQFDVLMLFGLEGCNI